MSISFLSFCKAPVGHMLGRQAVNRQAVVAAIHFGDSEADAVTLNGLDLD